METKAFLDWEEVFVSNEKGRRLVHYYLKGSDGSSHLAVVGREKSLRHMSYAVPSHFLRSLRHSSGMKWRSRREVVDWLSSLVTDSLRGSTLCVGQFLDDEYPCPVEISASKGLLSRKMKQQHSKEFSWVGSAWTCRKRRKHYQSFCRNGITISVHDFVYVMAEENKRLVAYLEDLYEDSKANNMVVVRWFHNIDEIGIVLPPKFNDREIFFSLCLQDLSVECIDGLATVLSPQHFEKFMNEARDLYLCHRMFDNNDIKPFDITQVKGYWNQKMLRNMYTSSQGNSLKPVSVNGFNLEINGISSTLQCRPRRKHGLKNGDSDRQSKLDSRETVTIVENSNRLPVGNGPERPVVNEATCSTKMQMIRQKLQPQLSVGCHVEVLSQDSGMRGCWFRAAVLKRHRNKVKVRYHDIRDADDTGNLEEWVLASRVANPDKFGIRLHGRTTVRPQPLENSESGRFDLGTAVDAWCFDGWWEGIVVRKESEDNLQVYFPGEARMSIVERSNLRRSQDWVCNRWSNLNGRPELVHLILSEQAGKSGDVGHKSQVGVSDTQPENSTPVNCFLDEGRAMCKSVPSAESPAGRVEESGVSNLAKDDSLAQLKWNSSKKRRRCRESLGKGGSYFKRQFDGSGSSSSSREEDESSPCNRFLIPDSLKVDHEICKFEGNSLFPSSMPPLSSLVMSR